MAFITTPQDGFSGSAIYGSPGNISIYIGTNSIGGETFNTLDVIVDSNPISSTVYLDGLPISGQLPYTVSYSTPALLQFDYQSLQSTVTLSLNFDGGNQVITYPSVVNLFSTTQGAASLIEINSSQVSSYNFGNVSVGTTQSVSATIGCPPILNIPFIYDVNFNLTGVGSPFSLNPSYPSNFTLGLATATFQIIEIEFSPTSVGAFSTTLDIEITTPLGPGSSWTNPVATLSIPITGTGVIPPTPPTYKSERLSIMNGISI